MTTASPAATLVISRPRYPSKGTAWLIPCAIASKSVIGATLSRSGALYARMRCIRRTGRLSGPRRWRDRVRHARGRFDRALQVLGREQLAGLGADRLVSGRDPALAEAAQDELGHRVRFGWARCELIDEGSCSLDEALVVEDP